MLPAAPVNVMGRSAPRTQNRMVCIKPTAMIDTPAQRAESALGMPWRRTPVHIARSTVDLGQPAAVGPEARAGLRGYGTYSGGSPAAQVRTIWAVVLRLEVPVLGIPNVAVSPPVWPISVAGLAACSANPARPDEVTQFRPPIRGG